MTKVAARALALVLSALTLSSASWYGVTRAEARPLSELPVSVGASGGYCDAGECARVLVVLQAAPLPGWVGHQHRVGVHIQCLSAGAVRPCRHVEVAPRLRAGERVIQGSTTRCGQLAGDQPCPSRVDAVLGWLPDSGGPYQGLATARVVLGATTRRIDVSTTTRS